MYPRNANGAFAAGGRFPAGSDHDAGAGGVYQLGGKLPPRAEFAYALPILGASPCGARDQGSLEALIAQVVGDLAVRPVERIRRRLSPQNSETMIASPRRSRAGMTATGASTNSWPRVTAVPPS